MKKVKVGKISIEEGHFVYEDYQENMGFSVSVELVRGNRDLFDFLSDLFRNSGLDFDSFLRQGGYVDLYE